MGKEDVLKTAGNLADVKKLLEQLEVTTPFRVQEIINPSTLMAFVKQALKDEVIMPLMGRTVQQLLADALEEAKDNRAAQVREGAGWQREVWMADQKSCC